MICEARNLTRVAVQLGISQSSISQMIQRWRAAVGDELFVRSRYGIRPTEAALALRDKVQPLSDDLRLALSQPFGFDATRSDRVFKIHMSDIGQLVFLPRLISHIREVAPGVRLTVRNFGWETIESALGAGDVELAIGSLPMIRGRVHARTLLAEKYVTVMRDKHPLAKTKLDLATFSAAEHLVIDSASSGHDLLEGLLRARGINRRIGLSVPHYSAIEEVLGSSNYLLTVPEIAASVLTRTSSSRVAAFPIKAPTFDIRVHWHERSRRDDGVQWLRSVLIELFGQRR
ncbi:PCP degradation transcriptional activation protein [Xanthomonas hydrangeae]|uniref:LysR family transcriptional regulator n=1 Tax=Xanthomonas hydrangeae TaxID=2775159 RepID=UPI001AF0D48D|nr:PCP degradation transcriptional activation protein [Xanthomonas hydrangeae]CAD7726528.1 PCP degradation transcriptional activation protein [Xanthomonas hydrangeae]CAD7742651.1 PCP degradation transcriptional activation protein [Xanthomonas hydrangeae]CAD7742654.1 PCP degradation transcriptional activation protein [Xanthomonas hydrangeae]